jgi:malonyl-CoA/methylmalonyl-CoA synthetase
MYSRLLEIEFSKKSLSNLRVLRCGSAPITEELHNKVESKFGCSLVVSYGLSEATCTSTLNPSNKRRIGSVGQALSGQEVFLDPSRVGSDDGAGEICIKGPSLMMGYLDEGSNGIPTLPSSILRTGDIGRFDSDGYLYITGRIKEVIIRGGENLSPNLIEEVISAIDGVLASCVIGRKDFDLGEVPIAFIVKKDIFSGKNLTKEILDSEILKKLSYIHRPVEYFFVNSLPENSIGKIDRKLLKQMYADGKEF